jgi:hypothetical protein
MGRLTPVVVSILGMTPPMMSGAITPRPPGSPLADWFTKEVSAVLLRDFSSSPSRSRKRQRRKLIGGGSGGQEIEILDPTD